MVVTSTEPPITSATSDDDDNEFYDAEEYKGSSSLEDFTLDIPMNSATKQSPNDESSSDGETDVRNENTATQQVRMYQLHLSYNK